MLEVEQIVQIAGAGLVLGAFLLSQANVLPVHSYLYLTLNLVGAGVLAVLAWQGQQWGFLMLEAAWAIASGVSLIAKSWRGVSA
jgi:hypothetical protein